MGPQFCFYENFQQARLFFMQNVPPGMFIPAGTFISYSRVATVYPVFSELLGKILYLLSSKRLIPGTSLSTQTFTKARLYCTQYWEKNLFPNIIFGVFHNVFLFSIARNGKIMHHSCCGEILDRMDFPRNSPSLIFFEFLCIFLLLIASSERMIVFSKGLFIYHVSMFWALF